LGQRMTAKELLRRPTVSYGQVAQLAELVQQASFAQAETPAAEPHISPLPSLESEAADEVDLQVKYENYIRKQEQMVHRTQRLEEMRIPVSLDYAAIPHLRTEARQKLLRTQPRTVGQAARVEGVTPADAAILMVYLEKQRSARALS
jgi:tRNA uridine 5-carboxymethylaminomethyl modification enzyme